MRTSGGSANTSCARSRRSRASTDAPAFSSFTRNSSRVSSSSSTTSTRSPPLVANEVVDCFSSFVILAAKPPAHRGQLTLNVAPCPSPPLSALTLPPWSCNQGRTMPSPRPDRPGSVTGVACLNHSKHVRQELARCRRQCDTDGPLLHRHEPVHPDLPLGGVNHRVPGKVPDHLFEPRGSPSTGARSVSAVSMSTPCGDRLRPHGVERASTTSASLIGSRASAAGRRDPRHVQQIFDELRCAARVSLDDVEPWRNPYGGTAAIAAWRHRESR